MEPLQRLHESVVEDAEIDALGHMNVRHYGERAIAATERLLEQLGVGPSVAGAGGFDLPRLYTRYQREQLAGAPLEVRGGLLEAGPEGLRCYHELVNPERSEIAATFMHDVRFPSEGAGERPVFGPAEIEALQARRVALPDHGRPRSIDLDAPVRAPSFDEAIGCGMAVRQPVSIAPEVCDAAGNALAVMRPFLMWSGETLDGSESGPPVIALPDAGRMGWASLEMRSVRLGPLRAGMRVQSFGAPVDVAKKTTLRRYWVFDLERREPVLANDVVDIALHLDERRAMEIPDFLRADLERQLRTDLR